MLDRVIVTALALAAVLPASVRAGDEEPESGRMLPFLGEEARKRGYEIPEPFGVGLVYYKLKRDIEITDVSVGRGDAPPVSVSHFVDFGSSSDVDNVNVKVDMFLFPFLLNPAALGPCQLLRLAAAIAAHHAAIVAAGDHPVAIVGAGKAEDRAAVRVVLQGQRQASIEGAHRAVASSHD